MTNTRRSDVRRTLLVLILAAIVAFTIGATGGGRGDSPFSLWHYLGLFSLSLFFLYAAYSVKVDEALIRGADIDHLKIIIKIAIIISLCTLGTFAMLWAFGGDHRAFLTLYETHPVEMLAALGSFFIAFGCRVSGLN